MEIFFAKADGNYTIIHFTETQTEVVTLNIGSLLELLPAGHFSRISRSALMNLGFLYKVDRKKRICELRKDGSMIRLEVSRDLIKDLLVVLSLDRLHFWSTHYIFAFKWSNKCQHPCQF